MTNTARRGQSSRKRTLTVGSSSRHGRASIRRTHGEPGRGNLADVALTGELDEKRNTPEMTQDKGVRGRPRENLDETLGPDIETHEDIER